MGAELNRLIALGGTGIASPVQRYQQARQQNQQEQMNRLSMLSSKQSMDINSQKMQMLKQEEAYKGMAAAYDYVNSVAGDDPVKQEAAISQVMPQLQKSGVPLPPKSMSTQQIYAQMKQAKLRVSGVKEKLVTKTSPSGVKYQVSSTTGEESKSYQNEAVASEAANKKHFSGQKIFKDASGTLFMGTGIGDPSTGVVTPSMEAVNGTDVKPKGKLRLVNALGQTSGEIPRYKSEILRREALEKDDVNFYTDYIDETRNMESSIGEIEMTQGLLNDLSGQAKYSTTGFAKFINKIPLTDANRWSELKSTIQSRIAMGKMLELKEASQTGSTGFGQLSEKELKVLMDHLGSLEQAQSPENIKKVISQIYDSMEGVKQGYRRKMLQNKKRFKTLHGEYYGSSRELPSLGQESQPLQQQVQAGAQQQDQATQLSPEDEEAVNWAKQNISDPRAIEILKRNGIN